MTNIEYNPDRVALMIGRTQPLHSGHIRLIDYVMERYPITIFCMGSVNEYRTEKNPWTPEEREYMIRNIYDYRFPIIPIADLGSCDNTSNIWIDYVIDILAKHNLPEPTDYFTGRPADSTWYQNKFWLGDDCDIRLSLPENSKYYLNRSNGKILRKLHILEEYFENNLCATHIREMISKNDSSWKKYIPETNHKFIERTFPEHLKQS
jgi:cytidyltransferase-like protein